MESPRRGPTRVASHWRFRLRDEMGELWEPFVAYALDRARAPSGKVASRLMREIGLPPISPDDLAHLTVPATRSACTTCSGSVPSRRSSTLLDASRLTIALGSHIVTS
jgi:hypothetical protein